MRLRHVLLLALTGASIALGQQDTETVKLTVNLAEVDGELKLAGGPWASSTSYGEGRSLLQVYSPSPSPQETESNSIIVNTATENTAVPCNSFYSVGTEGLSAAGAVTGTFEGYLVSIIEGSNLGPEPAQVQNAQAVIKCFNTKAGGQKQRALLQAVNPTRFITLTATIVTFIGRAQDVLDTFAQVLDAGTFTDVCKATLIEAQLDPSWAPVPIKYIDGTPSLCIVGVTECPLAPTPDNVLAITLPDTTMEFAVDHYVDNSKSCGHFWKLSRPRGKRPPNAAIRLALRTIADRAAAELGLKKLSKGGRYRIVRMSNLCTNPSRRVKKKHAGKKRMRTTVAPRLPSGINAEFLQRLRNHYLAGSIYQAALAWGAGEWAPKPFLYASGANAVCIPAYQQISGPCGKRWKPGRITPMI